MRRRRLAALALLALVAAAIALIVLPGGRTASSPSRAATRTGSSRGSGASGTASRKPSPARRIPAPSSFAVGLRMLRLVDGSRTIRLPDGTTVPRTLVTYVRYPALGPADRTDRRQAPAARSEGPFPLVIFGHGFTVTPELYARLLRDWARAGYVVAAPVFPLENANAPGGPNESDLINQPADMSFVISRLLAASAAASGPLAGLVDPRRIAVSGQSDGGETALAVAYDRYYRDPRVSAAVILSGAEIPGVGGFTFPAGSPPLLATQGTADTVNPPSFTNTFFGLAPGPKYLLSLLGAGHLPPYSDQQPQLGIVTAVTTDFLDAYLKRKPSGRQRMVSQGNVPGLATLLTVP